MVARRGDVEGSGRGRSAGALASAAHRARLGDARRGAVEAGLRGVKAACARAVLLWLGAELTVGLLLVVGLGLASMLGLADVVEQPRWGRLAAQDVTNPKGDFAKELPRLPVLDVEGSRKAIETVDGFRVELAASEPRVHDPVAVDFDENGRMFVVQLPPYNAYVLEDFKEQGSIAVLEDRDADGRYEASTLFASHLKYPSAIACWDGGVFVGDAPDLLYLKDTNGDGKADLRKVILTGFGTDKAGEAHLNSIRWGLDNRFHFSTSLSGGAIKRPGTDDEPLSVRNRGMVFDPRTGEFQLTSGGGQHGMSMDDWGRKFVCSNSVPAQQLMYDDRYAVRNPWLTAAAPAIDIAPDKKYTKLYRISPPEPWRVLRTRLRKEGKFRGSDEGGTPFGFFTGATGVTIYRGDNWPASHYGNLLVGDVANNLVYRASLERDGLRLVAVRADAGQDFLASRDMWFRPVQFANAPDGTLYILDMHRELIEGAAFLPPEFLKHIDASSGWDKGRIYRVVSATKAPRRDLPRLGDATSKQLVAFLQHPNGWHRDTAARLLYQRNDRSVAGELAALAAASDLPQGRAAALGALRGMGLLDVAMLQRALSDPSDEVRAFAIRLSEPLLDTSLALMNKLAPLADDPSPIVRYQLAFSLGASKSSESGDALARLAVREASDPWMTLATQSSLPRDGARYFAELAGNEAFRRTSHGANYLKTLIKQLGMRGQAAEVAAVVQALARLSKAVNDPANAGASTERALVKSLVEALVATQPAERRPVLLAAMDGGTQQLLKEFLDEAKRAAGDAKLPLPRRVDAVQRLRLASLEDATGFATPLLASDQPRELQLAAVDLLGTFRDRSVASQLLKAWPHIGTAARARTVETLLSRQGWAEQFLDAVDQGEIAADDVDSARVELLKQHPEPRIAGRAARLFASSKRLARQEVFKQYRPALTAKGDAARGKLVFKQNCSACHQLDGVGSAVGAELKGIAQRGLESVLLNVLDPNREVKPKFLTYAVQTEDGRVLSGMILTESANSITLRQADGANVPLQRSDIRRMRSAGISFMPEGLEKEIDIAAMADLLSYLSEH